jgi:hypothetical protein
VERVIGIEPTFTAWEAVVLPLDDTRRRPNSISAGRTNGNGRAPRRPFAGLRGIDASHANATPH